MKALFRFALPAIILLSLLGSCVPLEKVAYVQTEMEEGELSEEDLYFVGTPSDNTIRPGDELYIRVNSSDDEPTSFPDQMRTGVDVSLMSYIVDEFGYIKLPYVNKVKLTDLTLGQASDTIEKELAQFLYFPSVFIKFVNSKVTVLGEVRNPGVYVFNYKNINMLHALGYAGDITQFGNRQRVLLVREDGNQRVKKYLDVTNDEFLKSEFYLLKSNDIIYVEPLRRKKWDMSTVPYNLILSVISTGILIITFINTNNP